MYGITIKKDAKRKLQSLDAKTRLRITDKIVMLGNDPDDVNLDTKKLVGQALWRLRVGSWRIIYNRDDYLQILAIEKIGSRGDIYK